MSKTKHATHKRTRRHDRQQIPELISNLRQSMDDQLKDLIFHQQLGELHGVDSITSLGQVRIKR